ncbi:SSI family serine proteinase inhibitor [Streptomyces sp. DH20]|uniref:SSI family serine proteinase inhibitor n=1 Tax=Streptomyces sp. DH20 TaxID=2857009 RepID=UPI001E2F2854|nr:SSI family serine proteinase inhibitor [Streptomyces sp. DH20]
MTALSSFLSWTSPSSTSPSPTSPLPTPTRRRLLAGGAALVAVLASLAASPSPARAGEPAPDGDRLTVTVRDAGGGADGTYVVRCRPSGGTHPDPDGACAAVERRTRWGQDAFAPVPRDAVCTMQYGGPATARITGTWAGRRVDATYDRTNGCAIERWDRLVPLLPEAGRAEGAPAA